MARKDRDYRGLVGELTNDEQQGKVLFGAALAEAMSSVGMRQADLAERFGTSQSTVSAWMHGKKTRPVVVFAIEDILGLDPGTLSRHLGYLPVVTKGATPATFDDCVEGDRLLSASQKSVVKQMYEEFVGRRGRTLRD